MRCWLTRTAEVACVVIISGCGEGDRRSELELPAEAGACPLEEPEVFMHVRGERYAGGLGSSCLLNDTAGCGRCLDRNRVPAQSFATVAPDEAISFSVRGALLTGSDRCQPSCPPMVYVYRRGCDRERLNEQIVEDRAPVKLALEPGAYHLILDTHYEGMSDTSGSFVAGFGLTVEGTGDGGASDSLDASSPNSCSPGL